jgi:hypothetical protein
MDKAVHVLPYRVSRLPSAARERELSPARMRESRTLGAAEPSVNAARAWAEVTCKVAGARGVLALRQAAERQSIPINNRSARGGWAPSFCANAGASIGGHAAIRFTEAVRRQRKRDNLMPTIEAPHGAFPFVGKGGLRPSPRLGMAANTVRIIKTAGSRGLKLIAKHPIGALSDRLWISAGPTNQPTL